MFYQVVKKLKIIVVKFDNMKSGILIIVLFGMISSLGYAQIKADSLEIKYLPLRDILLKKEIENFATYKNNSDSLFKSGMGYLVLFKNKLDRKLPVGVIALHYLNVNYVDYDVITNDQILPLYYTYTDAKRLVLIYNSSLPDITGANVKYTSKQLLKEILEPFLPATIDIDSPNMDQKPAKMRLNPRLQLHGGINLLQMKDKTYKTVKATNTINPL